MSFSISCHPSPKGVAPVRIECLVKEAEEQAGPNGRWDYEFKVTLGTEGWRGRSGTLEAPTEPLANMRVRLMIIEELGTWLADLYSKANPTKV